MKALITSLIVALIIGVVTLVPSRGEFSSLKIEMVELHERQDYQEDTAQRIERKVDRVIDILMERPCND